MNRVTIPKLSRAFRQIIGVIGFALVLLIITLASKAQSIDIPLVSVGNAGNAADPRTGRGAVNYEYSIGKYDVTIAEYAAFLNAVAKRDKYRLYSPHKMDQMGRMVNSDTVNNKTGGQWDAGIARLGESGNYTYSVIGDSGKIPAVWITWFDAARFCNWMHNGQPTDLGEVAGSTETGAYTLNGDRIKGGQTRNPGAKWWLPSADEWYKAAFYDPRLNGGAGGYWRYPTQSNTAPGNEIGNGSNEANAIANATFSVKAKRGQEICLLTPVGAFPNSRSYYGCFDMCGNATQWTDTIIITRYTHAKGRGLVGGGVNVFTNELQSTNNSCAAGGMYEREDLWVSGFRVATIPRPASGKQ